MSALRKFAYALAATVATVTMAAAPSSPAQAAGGTQYGCPSGAVCLYSGMYPEDINRGPVTMWWDGAHNLNNVFGHRAVFNNQYGGWTVQICRGWNGTNCPPGFFVPEGTFGFYDMTPINSVWLHAGNPVW
ncbi:hypothetical protein [Couchioplanes azureus]|uniref:hypothetical protein n=1 Tax=Couchioplanes caeruleus TaxID=56438 RepID=UPI0016717DE9|nr:hypothetical protein [Couchioplanes caeruleus]GGQ43807.1 hypothetical protein GCM10010166_10360 [Couchioplanes caeruleus subsp. azureus]